MGTETTGRLHLIFDTKQVSERFTKREFVVEIADNPKYPQRVLFQLTGDRVSQLDDLRVGDSVRIEYSLRGREWTSPSGEVKYFNSLDAWKIEAARANAGSDRRGGRGNGRMDREDGAPPPAFEPRPSDLGMTRDDDLPF